MYKRIKGEIERETVRPHAYHAHLDDGWVVDIKDVPTAPDVGKTSAEEIKNLTKKSKKVKNDNKNKDSK